MVADAPEAEVTAALRCRLILNFGAQAEVKTIDLIIGQILKDAPKNAGAFRV